MIGHQNAEHSAEQMCILSALLCTPLVQLPCICARPLSMVPAPPPRPPAQTVPSHLRAARPAMARFPPTNPATDWELRQSPGRRRMWRMFPRQAGQPTWTRRTQSCRPRDYANFWCHQCEMYFRMADLWDHTASTCQYVRSRSCSSMAFVGQRRRRLNLTPFSPRRRWRFLLLALREYLAKAALAARAEILLAQRSCVPGAS